MEIIKDYLSANEMRLIKSTVVSFDDFMDREYIKILMVADFCTDIKLIRGENDSVTFSEDIYDNMVKDNDVDKLYLEIKNIYTLEDYINSENDITNIIKDFAKTLKDSIENVDVNGLGKALEELKEIK